MANNNFATTIAALNAAASTYNDLKASNTSNAAALAAAIAAKKEAADASDADAYATASAQVTELEAVAEMYDKKLSAYILPNAEYCSVKATYLNEFYTFLDTVYASATTHINALLQIADSIEAFRADANAVADRAKSYTIGGQDRFEIPTAANIREYVSVVAGQIATYTASRG